VSVLAVIYGVKRIAEGDAGALPALSIALGLAVGATFLHRQTRLADPMIDTRLFRVPAFSVALAGGTFALFAVYGMDLFIAQYLQLVLGLNPFEAGLWLLPAALGFVIGSNLAPLIAARVPTAQVLGGGAAVTAIGLALLTQVEAASGLAVLVAGSVVMSLGAAQIITLGTDVVVGAVPPERAGSASGISETGLELGGALGIALLGSIGAAVSGGHTFAGAETFVHGMQLAALTAAVVMAAVAAITLRLLRERRVLQALPAAC
jgi:MFS transporter, DHA2 family, multidrug resistance protein